MAQSDGHSTGDQEIVGLIPVGSGNLIQEGQMSVSGKRMDTRLVNHLED